MKEQVFLSDYGIIGAYGQDFRIAKGDKIFPKKYKTLSDAVKNLHKKMSKDKNL